MKKRIISVFIAVVMMVTAVPFAAITTMAETPMADPGVDLLLRGFNIFGGQDLRRTTLMPSTFVNRDELATFGINSWDPGIEVSYNYSAGRSILEMMSSSSYNSSFGVEAKFGYSGLLFKTSVEAKYSSSQSNTFSYTESLESFFSMMQVYKELGRNRISRHDLEFYRNEIWESNVFNSVFKQILAGEGAWENRDISEVFDAIGTHVLTSYMLGGYAETTVGIVRTSLNTTGTIEEEFKISASASFGVGKDRVTGSAKTNYEEASTINQSESRSGFEHNVSGHAVGGTVGHAALFNPDSSTMDYSAWLDSINSSNLIESTGILINDRLEMIPIWELLPFTYAERRLELQTEFLKLAQDIEDNFFNEFIYSQRRPTAANMPVPEFNNEFTIISTPAQFRAMTPDGKYILSNDIDLSGFATWTPFPTTEASFVLEGNGNTVRNVNVAVGDTLFGVNNGVIKNFSVAYNAPAHAIVSGGNGKAENCFVEIKNNYDPARTPDRTITTIAGIANQTINTAGHVLVDLSALNNSNISNGRQVINIDGTLTVGDNVKLIEFKGRPDQIFWHLQIDVLGDTEIVFRDFAYNSIQRSGPALRFRSENSILRIMGGFNQIGSDRARGNEVLNSSVVYAAGNLYIHGNGTIDVYSFVNSGNWGASTSDAIVVNGALTVALDGTLNARANAAANGANGTTGLGGGNGGNGGHGIVADSLIILNNSNVIVRGGSGGTGGTGGQGATGWNAPHAGWGGGSRGGDGGVGGNGGHGGNGGTPLVISNQNLYQSINYSLTLTAGRGGNGGNGGQGGTGGIGSWNSFNNRNAGGNGGRGGNGGDGGFHGSLATVNGTVGNDTHGVAGGSAGSGGLLGNLTTYRDVSNPVNGLPGNSGISHPTIDSSLLTYEKIGTSASYMWSQAQTRLILNNNTSRASGTHEGTLIYHPGEVFDVSHFNMNLSDGKTTVRPNQLSVRYDFSKLGATLVTITYFTGGGRHVRYIPVVVEEACIEKANLITPQQITRFFPGTEFNHDGLAVEVFYCDGGYELIALEAGNLNFPAGIAINNITAIEGDYIVMIASINHSRNDELMEMLNTDSYKVTVSSAVPNGIRVVHPPYRTDYRVPPRVTPEYLDNILDLNGIVVMVDFEDGSEEAIPINVVQSITPPTVFESVRTENITISYICPAGKTFRDTFAVDVTPDRIIENTTNVQSFPKQAYFVGETFVTTGFEVRVDLESGFRLFLNSDDFTFEKDGEALRVIDNEIRAMCKFRDRNNNNFWIDIPITVVAETQTGITVSQNPAKTSYIEGQTFDSEGLVVRSVWNNPIRNRILESNEYKLSPDNGDILSVNDTSVTVTSGSFMKTIPITVIAKINVETPKITAQPQSGTVGQNTWRELFVEAETSDNGTLTYQWFSNDTASNTGGAAIDGATRANLTVPTEELGTKHYYVVITNTIPNNGDGGTKTASVTSAVATITVSEVINAEEPVITVQPQNATINAGTAHSLSVTATSPDSGTLTYQWYSSKVADLEEIENEDDVAEIDGATSATYSPPTNTTGTYYYFVLVTNEITDNGDGGQKSASFISEIVTLTINETTSFIKVTTPTISANGSNPSASRTITLASEAGAIIYYTIDGSTPTIESLKYTAPFTLNFQSVGTSHTVRAIAVKENMANSDAAIQVFTRTQNNAGGGGGGGGGATTPPTEPTNPSSGITIINITVEAGGTLNIGGVHNTFINNISVPMLQIKVPASVTGNQSVSIGSDFAGQNAVLVKLNASTNELEFVSVSTVGTNGNANMNIAQAGEYFALTFKTGDVTGTGEVQTADALALLRHIAGISELNSVQLFVANGKEGDVGTNDALNILRLVAGIIEKI